MSGFLRDALKAARAANVGQPKRGRRAKALARRLTRSKDQNQDGKGVRQHLQEEAEVGVKVEYVAQPKDFEWPLNIENQPPQGAERICAERCAQWIPLGEDHQADRDPALAAGGKLAKPARRDCQTDR